MIERVLFEPLANLDMSQGLGLTPGSVLLVGVPGTGKTLLAELFLSKDTGVFLVPVDPLDLAKDLIAPSEKKRILPRISQVFKDTGRPVVLQLDDIEGVAQDQQNMNSTLLNLMAGVRSNGFFVLASTNHPEDINPQLLQPERFAHVVYTGMPDEGVRRAIIEVHATRVSRELGIPLFASDEERVAIITAIAQHTEGYTSRYLADICTCAKTQFLHRMVREHNGVHGLTEEDIRGTFTQEDWTLGFEEADSRFDSKIIKEWDERIQKFVQHQARPIGFIAQTVYNRTEELRRTMKELYFNS